MEPVHSTVDAQAILDHRARKDRMFSGHHSPLEPADRRSFSGLSYYEPDPSFSLRLEVQAGDGSAVRIQTSDGLERTYRNAGTVSFDIDGESARLTLYDTDHGLFLPFRDATSGKETYGAGRYLDLEEAAAGFVEVDFNLAYYPLCAYNEAYSCPLPPVENWLKVPIRAGERDHRP